MTNTPVEETWWKVTTTTGLVLTLPAPLRLTSVLDTDAKEAPIPPAMAIEEGQWGLAVESRSALTGKSYALSLRDVIHIEVFTLDPSRYAKALERAVLRRSSDGSSDDSQAPASPSRSQGSPSGRSIGARIKPPTH